MSDSSLGKKIRDAIKHPDAFQPIPLEAARGVRQAFRDAVKDQIEALTQPGKHVHHDGSATFENLFIIFWLSRSDFAEDVKLAEDIHGKIEITDEKLKREWQEFHQSNARLVLMNKREHLRLPRRKRL